MQSITLRGHVGSDGIMHLQVPVGTPEADFEVMVIFQPIVKTESKKTPEELGWPPGFFERTAGSIPDLERAPQGEYEVREPL